jgi:hypothetical protein
MTAGAQSASVKPPPTARLRSAERPWRQPWQVSSIHLPTSKELSTRAELLEDAPPIWEALMDEFRMPHLGAPSKGASVAGRHEALVARNAAQAGGQTVARRA